MKTIKVAALAKFLERKLQVPNGLASVDPKLVELAVKNAKQTVQCSGTSASGRIIHHVDSFGDDEDTNGEEITITAVPKKNKQKKKNKQGKIQKKKEKVRMQSIGVYSLVQCSSGSDFCSDTNTRYFCRMLMNQKDRKKS
ncbi:hypothetical protein ACS0TY_017640 [Phlomoides rotata]